MATPEPIYGEVGREGLVIPLGPFRTRLGGNANLTKVLKALSVTEKVGHNRGRPKGMARTIRRAYIIEKEDGVERLLIPRTKGSLFLRHLNAARLPLLDGIRVAPEKLANGKANPNAPLPPPRKIEQSRLVPEEPLYEYQEAAVEFLCSEAGPFGSADPAAGVAYLQMDTGLGKSRVGCGVIARRGEPALIVVPTDAIAGQWVEEFAEIYPNLRVEVYRNPLKTSRRVSPNPQTHDVLIVIVNTFREKTPEFMEGFGTVILDEAHEYHSVHNCRALWLSQTKAVLGLSATPEERPDGLDLYVHCHLGAVILPKKIPGFDICAVNFKGQARIVEYSGDPKFCQTVASPSGTMSAILTIGAVIQDAARLRLVAAEVKRLYLLHETSSPEELMQLGLGPRPASAATPTHPEGEIRRHGVFVFAEHRDYLPELQRALLECMKPEDILVPELDENFGKVSILRGGVAKNAVGCARRAGAHIVLTTYGFSRRGISLPDMTCIVAATPRRNGIRQILGRVLRRGSDESIVRQIVDIVDMRTGLRSQVTDRQKIYLEKKYPVTKIGVSWKEYSEQGADANAFEVEDEFAELTLDDLLAAAVDGKKDSA